jgi:hypothetical protein
VTEEKKNEIKIDISLLPGRWGKIFHISDAEGGKISLQMKDATRIARTILKEAKGDK